MIEPGAEAPTFELKSLDGPPQVLGPGNGSGPTLLAFLATDCPTCQLTFPYLDKLEKQISAKGGHVIAISQDGPKATRRFAEQVGGELPIALDAKLDVTRDYDPVAVPTLVLVDADFKVTRTDIGFSKKALNEIGRAMAEAVGVEATVIAEEQDGAPPQKPGCGSRHHEVEEGAGAPEPEETAGAYVKRGARASRIELSDDVDPYDYCMEHGFADPLPVVPPTVERVEKFLAATDLPPDEVIALVPPNYGKATVEKIAANAVMAGCEPKMMKFLIPMVRALCDENFNVHGITATTHFATPLMIVNGPICDELGFHSKKNVFSNISRTNSTAGRALQLILTNVGGGGAAGIDMSALGNPGKFSYCIAENTDESPWQPFHVDRGFKPEQSTVTMFAAEPPIAVSEHNTKHGEVILGAISAVMKNLWTRRGCIFMEAVVVLGPEHVKTLTDDGWDKEKIRTWLFENTGIPIAEYESETAKGSEGTAFAPMYPKTEIDGVPCYQKFRGTDAIHILVSGGTAGKFSCVIGSWLSGPRGSIMATYPID